VDEGFQYGKYTMILPVELKVFLGVSDILRDPVVSPIWSLVGVK